MIYSSRVSIWAAVQHRTSEDDIESSVTLLIVIVIDCTRLVTVYLTRRRAAGAVAQCQPEKRRPRSMRARHERAVAESSTCASAARSSILSISSIAGDVARGISVTSEDVHSGVVQSK